MTPLPLRDVHEGVAPAWWPPAPGWWLLLGAIVIEPLNSQVKSA